MNDKFTYNRKELLSFIEQIILELKLDGKVIVNVTDDGNLEILKDGLGKRSQVLEREIRAPI